MKKKLKSLSVFLPIFICHLIVFLAFYPGMCTYDLNTQIEQYLTHSFCTNHPLLHTLFVGVFHDLFTDDINLGYAFATVIQLLIVDGAMTYSVMYIRSICKDRFPWIIAAIFYAVFPVNSMLAISHTKDTLFAAFGLIFFIDSIRIFSEAPAKNYLFIIRMTVSATLMSLMRNNAVYALSAALIVIIIKMALNYRSKNKSGTDKVNALKRYALIVFATVLLSVIGGRMLSYATSATPGSIKEMMSIPAQIMGRVYNSDSATEEEKALISEYIPNAEEYKFYISDPMKKDLPFEIWESKCKHFLLDSTIIALHHPVITAEAVWYSIQGYIDPFHMPYSSDHFYLARYDYRGGAELASKIPLLCDLYVKLFRTTYDYSRTPIIIVFNLGLYVWITLAAFITALIRNKKRPEGLSENIAYLFPIMYLLTLLLGPAAIMRYGYLYVLTAPGAFTSLFYPISGKN